MPALILLVDPNRATLHQTEALLTAEGYLVAAVATFPEARDLLHSVDPDLLIVDIQRSIFNGLHLVARSRHDYPRLPVIITHDSHDPAFEHEAQRLGSTLFVRPWDNAEFLQHVKSLVGEYRWPQMTVRRWVRKRLSGTLEAHAGGAPARIVDISYGGLRLAFPDPKEEPPPTFDVTLLANGLRLTAHRIWTQRVPGGVDVWCGVELLPGEATTDEWHQFVDTLT